MYYFDFEELESFLLRVMTSSIGKHILLKGIVGLLKKSEDERECSLIINVRVSCRHMDLYFLLFKTHSKFQTTCINIF
jgi:hypothetical protein